jgi:TolB-like protein
MGRLILSQYINNKLFFIFILLVSSFSLSSCTHRMAFGGCDYRMKTGECQANTVQDADIKATSYAAADNLLRHFSDWQEPNPLLLVTSIADLDNLEDSTSLGRLIGEQLSARFAQQGYPVIEAKLYRGLIKIPRTGEFVLSREVQAIGRARHASIIVAGTYATGKDKLYVTLKMLNRDNGEVMSSYAYDLPIGPNTSTLLKKSFWF